MLWVGAYGFSAAGWLGLVVASAAVGAGIGVLIGNTHPPQDRNVARAVYCFVVLAWGAMCMAATIAFLDTLARGMNASM